jgi:hypothetical protein
MNRGYTPGFSVILRERNKGALGTLTPLLDLKSVRNRSRLLYSHSIPLQPGSLPLGACELAHAEHVRQDSRERYWQNPERSGQSS